MEFSVTLRELVVIAAAPFVRCINPKKAAGIAIAL